MASAVRAQVNVAARSRAATPTRSDQLRVVEQALQGGGDGVDVERVDQDRRVAGHLGGRRGRRGHDGGALHHRLEHGEAEALPQARVGDDAWRRRRARRGRPSGTNPRRRTRGPATASRSVLHPSGPTITSSASISPSAAKASTSRPQVLAGLDGAGEEHEGPVAARTASRTRAASPSATGTGVGGPRRDAQAAAVDARPPRSRRGSPPTGTRPRPPRRARGRGTG